jgi:hypothetical protein
VTTTADSGPGSLRDAITQVNADTSHTLYASPSNPSVDEIDFAIPADDPNGRHFYYLTDHTIAATSATDDSQLANIAPDWQHSWWSIQPTAPLPEITNPVIIDGYTQGQNTPQAARPNDLAQGSDAVLRIELDGSRMGLNGPFNSAVLSVASGNSLVRGLVVNHYTNAEGIEVKRPDQPTAGQTGDNNRIQGNYIGTDVSGTRAFEQVDFGIFSHGPSYGLQVWNGSRNNVIGTDGDGTNDPGERNLISGNWWGVALRGSSQSFQLPASGTYSAFNVVAGNYIGTDASGLHALPNWVGVDAGFAANHDTIGVVSQDRVHPEHVDFAAEGNLISGNDVGLAYSGGGVPSETYGLVAGNKIGTDATGATALTGTALLNGSPVTFTGN